jgi:hypothetical protein
MHNLHMAHSLPIPPAAALISGQRAASTFLTQVFADGGPGRWTAADWVLLCASSLEILFSFLPRECVALDRALSDLLDGFPLPLPRN